MPFYLKDLDILPEVAGLESVLVVPCRFCPAATLAVREGKPYLEPLRRLMRTEAYETYIRDLVRRLEDAGVRADVFDSTLPHHYVACMWTEKRRKALARRAGEYDAVVVLGCSATAETVRDAMGSTDCRVIQGMEVESIMNILPRVSFPFSISLVVRAMSPV